MTWVYYNYFWLFDTIRFSGGISSWVLPGAIPEGASSPLQMGETFFHFGTDQPLVGGCILDPGSGGSRSQFNLLSLIFLNHLTAFSIFPETSPFDFYDVIDKSGVWGSGKTVDFGVMQMWFESYSTHQFCGLTK